MDMNGKKTLWVTIVAMAVFVAAGASAKANDSKNVVLGSDAVVAGTHLRSGEYNIQWETHSPAATVSFLRRGKVVATAEGKVVDRGTKYSSNEVVYTVANDGARQIQEIRFRGSSEVIEFKQ